MAPLKVLCVHGIGRHGPSDSSWQDAWKLAVGAAVRSVGASGSGVSCSFCYTDDLFSKQPLTVWQTMDAIATLGGNAIFGSSQRGLFDGDNVVGWTAGMVLQWAGNERLRQQARQRLLQAIKNEKPDVIIAHSLGSLIAYDLLGNDEGAGVINRQTLLTIGSQINSRFVGGIFEYGVVPLNSKARWFHVYDANDHVFTAQIHFDGAKNFRQIVASPFGSGLTGGHTDLMSYLNDPLVLKDAWTPILTVASPQIEMGAPAGAAAMTTSKALSVAASFTRPPNKKALLIGINEYVDPANRLEGCVNDVYSVSALLQECEFLPEDIRVVFDGRATAQGIRERLGWLYADTRDGDIRFLYYSGHGLQMPVYGKNEQPDRMVEALVAADFDGTLDNCITDRDFSAFYAGLPRGSTVIIALDCCYAGGLTRKGEMNVRGINPPDDIRHRMLKWDAKSEMWIPREFVRLIPGKKATTEQPKWRVGVSGKSGCVARIGSSIDHRRMTDDHYDKLRSATGWQGPFQPLVITACRENQTSSEYLHGAVSYGAFTFAFCKTVRSAHGPMTYLEALTETGTTLESLGYEQTPSLAGPSSHQSAVIPFRITKPKSTAKKPTARKSSTKKAAARTKK
jgi:hypothetical protein